MTEPDIEQKGLIFDIERFATEDGPGIRTVVFFKGCSLKCQWCANPESQSVKPEIMVTPSACRMCGACMQSCKNGAIVPDPAYGMTIDDQKCTRCGECIDACVYDARHMAGKWYTVSELIDVLLKDKEYYDQSGGGVTFSGGEPLLQEKFLTSLACRLKDMGIPLLLETCGMVPWVAFDRTANLFDIIYFDIKHINSTKHKEGTGKGNKQVLSNCSKLDKIYTGNLFIRYPYIKGFNDSAQDIRRFLAFCNELTNINEVVFLPYHRLGVSKYKGLGRPYALPDMETLKKSDLSHVITIGREFKSKISIGG